MVTDTESNEDAASTNLPVDVTAGSHGLQFIETVPISNSTDDPCTTKCDTGDWPDAVKQENLPAVKQECEYVGDKLFELARNCF